MVTAKSVRGHRAFLPCDLRPPSQSEQVYLVLWYRGDEGEPIYRSDHTSKVREKYFQFNLSRVVTMLVMAPGTSGRGGVTRVSLETELTSSSAHLLPSSGWRTSRTRRREFTGVVWTSR